MEIRDISLQKRETFWDYFHILGVLLIILFNLFFIVSPMHDYKIRNLIINPLAISLVAIAASRYRGGFPWLMVPSFLFPLWYYCVHVLNGNYYLLDIYDVARCIGIMMVWILFYGTPLFFQKERREKIAGYFSWLLLATLGALAWVENIAFALELNIVSPFSGFPIITFFNLRFSPFFVHPNIAASLYFTAIFCGIYLLCRTPHKWLKGLIVLLIVGLFLAFSFTESRTAFVGFSISMGALAFLLCWRSKRLGTQKKKILIGAIAMILVIILVLGGLWGGRELAVMKMWQMANRGYWDDYIPREYIVIETRGFSQDAETLTGRTDVYQSVFTVLRENPSILWKGSMEQKAMELVNDVLKAPEIYGHAHNSFLHTLLITGIPGLLISLAFCGLIILQGARLFFARPSGVPLSSQIWVLLAAALLVSSMMEHFLFSQNMFLAYIFFFASGMVTSSAKDLLPPVFQKKAAL